MTTATAHDHEGHVGWLEHTVAGISGSIERSIFTEEHARSAGWLQALDPRAKLGMFLAVILAASLSSSILTLIALYAVILVAAAASRIPFDFFVRRVWLGIPFFAAIVVIPAIFFVDGPRLFELTLGPVTIAPSIPGLIGAVLFVIRVAVAVAVLLVSRRRGPTCSRAFGDPRAQVFIRAAMTYRYIFLFLHLANGMFEARKSRVVGRTSGNEQRRWIAGSMGNLLNRSVKMSNDVYAAMAARGFTGTIRSFHDCRCDGPTGCRSRRRSASPGPCRDGEARAVTTTGERAGRSRRPSSPRAVAGVFELHGCATSTAAARSRSTASTCGSSAASGSPAGCQRLGQVHAAQAPRRDRRADRRHHARARPRRRRRRRRAGRVPLPPRGRAGVPGPGHPAVLGDGVRRRRLRPLQLGLTHDEVRRRATRRCARWTSRTSPTGRRSSCPGREEAGGDRVRAAAAARRAAARRAHGVLDPRTKWVLVNLIRQLGSAARRSSPRPTSSRSCR
jgi:cobalt/nickel transport system permease protein